jgi:hypothetical protein
MRHATTTDPVARALAGMRRVDAVRVVEGPRLRFYVEGVGHRMPACREISLSVASALMQRLPTHHEWHPAEADVEADVSD